MALKRNAFTSDLEEFIDHLVVQNHYQYFVKRELKGAKERIETSLEAFSKKGLETNKFWMGTRLPLIDLFHRTGGEFTIHAPTKGRVTAGSDMLALADETERRFNSMLVVSLHEAFEGFLKSMYGKMLYQQRQSITIRDKKRFKHAKPKLAKKEGTLQFFQEYAQYVCRHDCQKALDDFAKQLEWKKVVIDRIWKMSFGDLAGALSFCRHVIVHKQGRVLQDSIRELSKDQAEFVKRGMHKSLHGKEPLYLPETSIVEKWFTYVASYAHALYVLVSERCGMGDETPYFK